jgi:hypothetical protein
MQFYLVHGIAEGLSAEVQGDQAEVIVAAAGGSASDKP